MAKVKMVKMKAGNFRIPVVIRPEKGRLFFQFPFNRALMEEVKNMQGAKWHGYDDEPQKLWSVKDSGRNRFQIEYLCGGNPYKHYDKELLIVTASREEAYDHQVDMIQHGLTRRRCILSCEMRTGKTLAAIEIMEQSGYMDWIWLGPKSALPEIELQFETWKAKIIPRFMTYERLRKEVKEGTFTIPDGMICDESTKVKNPTAQRSQATYFIAEAMREKNPDCFIILMSGAPAPKSPADWWHQCEIACPGFLKEGNLSKFKQRLALIKQKESVSGGVYPDLITWLDDESKCKVCGKHRDAHYTAATATQKLMQEDHSFEPSENEVSLLYERMQGLTLVKFRKDCLDLPETQFRTIRVEATKSTQRAAKLILKTAPRTVTALMLSRELSDGFQYRNEETSRETCSVCKGSGKGTEFFDPEYPNEPISDQALREGRCESRKCVCGTCKGRGHVAKITRIAKEIPCPKEQVLIDLLDEHEVPGRFVVYAGFQASIDRCVKIALRYQWDVIRVDGRGWSYFSPLDPNPSALSKKDMLRHFQSKEGRNTVFIGQPGAAGMGLTLTASPSVFFFSNSFDAEHRLQAVERVQGLGMDLNRGATVIDVIHLDIDEHIVNNLKKKTDLMHLTMGKLREITLEKINEPTRR
jgi:hypothetical protein